MQMVALPKRSVIEKQVTAYRKMITVHPKGHRAFQQHYHQARRLYKMLFRPMSQYLVRGHRLIIVPDGILYYLPFETLVKTVARSSDQAAAMDLRVRYLVEDHSITYAPSAAVLGDLLAKRKESVRKLGGRKRELLAYGDPVFSLKQRTARARTGPEESKLGEIVRGVYEGRGIKFPPLPSTRAEVEGITRLYPPTKSKAYLGSKATEASVKTEKLSQYKRLHFATHAIIDEAVPVRSGVVLSLVDTGDEDGILQMREIFNLELEAELVVLSACQTALGKMVRGEGIVGLTRAFMYAGAPSLAVSLWPVNDFSTAEFMKMFYQKMKAGQGNGDALRAAKLEMIHSESPAYRHPYFWAAFVLVGAM